MGVNHKKVNRYLEIVTERRQFTSFVISQEPLKLDLLTLKLDLLTYYKIHIYLDIVFIIIGRYRL